jgi:uncharacterized protein (UPF0335 family)
VLDLSLKNGLQRVRQEKENLRADIQAIREDIRVSSLRPKMAQTIIRRRVNRLRNLKWFDSASSPAE